VPDEIDEAAESSGAGGEDAVRASRVSRQLLGGFLLRHGMHYEGKSRWSQAHMRWILAIKMPHAAQQIVLEEYRLRVEHDIDRVASLTTNIRRLVAAWRWEPVVDALQALRSVRLITAVARELCGFICDIGQQVDLKAS
jgi:hypothetical protein